MESNSTLLFYVYKNDIFATYFIFSLETKKKCLNAIDNIVRIIWKTYTLYIIIYIILGIYI